MTAPPSEAPARPSPGSLAALVVLGAATALWSLFLWVELVQARSGGMPFCPLGDAGQCSTLWDAEFSRAVHKWSGLPIAGWGMVWGLATLALPLLALKQLAEGKSVQTLTTATRVLSAAGVLAAFVLGGVAASLGVFCAGCFATYLLVAGYAGIALLTWRDLGLQRLPDGIAQAIGAISGAFMLLLYPGMRTPKSVAETQRQAVARAAQPTATAGDSGALRDFVQSLEPGLKQSLSDALGLYRSGIAFPMSPARALVGKQDAPLRITEFTDVLCDHCAQLHETLVELGRYAPAGSFSVEPRQFPLDAACNPAVERSGSPVRCLAAKAQICLEGDARALDYQGALFAKQKTLTSSDVYVLAGPYMPRTKLEACIASADTGRKLQDDIELASRYELDGTPLVLLNGKKAVSLPAFLYAMILTGGAADHPILAALPPPNPNAHIH